MQQRRHLPCSMNISERRFRLARTSFIQDGFPSSDLRLSFSTSSLGGRRALQSQGVDELVVTDVE